MRSLIYSDVHGNIPAFESMLKAVGFCDQYICLGDLVNYGPWSNECVDLAVSLPNSIILKGNHEEAFIQGFYPGKNSLVQNFFQQTFNAFSRIKTIEKFRDSYDFKKFICRHTYQDQYIYPDTDIVLNGNYIIGHSHHQFEYNNSGYTLFNAGSVGQNRKYINVANYLVFNDETNLMEMGKTIFSIDIVIKQMKALNYPEDCINYYLQKAVY